MRIILVTGKGGVGKTSVAAATAVRSARLGHRTLVTSTDPAHSLSDALGVGLSDEPSRVADNLDGAEIDGRARLVGHWEEIRAYFADVLRWGGVDGVQAEELTVLPGLEELFALIDIRHHAHEGAHDVLVVDCAPTAETLRLLSLPDSLGWCLEHAFGFDAGFGRMVRPILGKVTTMPLPTDAVFGSVEQLYRMLVGVRDLLLDGERATVRLVTNAERVVVAETRRTFTALSLFGYHVDAVVANRLLPEAVVDPRLRKWQERQAAQLACLRADFDPPVLTACLAEDEVVGVEALDGLASSLHGNDDPTAVLHRAEPLTLSRHPGELHLSVGLPFAEREHIDVLQRGDQLHVRVGTRTRSIVLPSALRGEEVLGAGLADGRLVVRFRDVSPDAPRQLTELPHETLDSRG